jgi:tight adherence protein B
MGLLLAPLLYLILRHRVVQAQIECIQDQLAKEFLDALRTISAALLAGFSMENAWREAEKEIGALYGRNSYMYRELEAMNQSVSLNVPLENLLEDFAVRSGNADIASFSEVFAFAKRSGGNFVTIIEGTSAHMRARYDTEREIQVLVASRKMEQKVMNVIPMLILAYLKVTSIGFLDILYRNMAGVLFMSVCLAAYGGSVLLAEKILRIRM